MCSSFWGAWFRVLAAGVRVELLGFRLGTAGRCPQAG